VIVGGLGRVASPAELPQAGKWGEAAGGRETKQDSMTPGNNNARADTGSAPTRKAKKERKNKGSPVQGELAAEPTEGLLIQMFQEKNEKAILPLVVADFALSARRLRRHACNASSLLLFPQSLATLWEP